MPFIGWVSDADWARMMAQLTRIDKNTQHLANVDARLNQLLGGQDILKTGQQVLNEMEQKQMVDISAIQAEVTRNNDVANSVKTLIGSLADQIAALKTASTDPQTQAAIDALVGQLKGNDDSLADAVTANTPAAPPPT
jgi:hypothetical protein